ncbi:MAG: GNAT family N-acetyltransferase [Clostridiales bacterium]|nr:GNAT family N-acetyltransferase [Clostridiales bacterium]
MKFKIYNFLSDDAKIIRKQVFMEEQGFKNEFDDIDNISFHIVMYDENRPVATCRVYEDIVKNEYILGRLSVVKEYRGMSLGAKMIGEAEKIVKEKGGTSIRLHAQCRVTPFYGQQGYKEYGVIEDDEGCPHIWMKKQL